MKSEGAEQEIDGENVNSPHGHGIKQRAKSVLRGPQQFNSLGERANEFLDCNVGAGPAFAQTAAADVFELLEFESQESLLHQLSRDRISQILNEMAPDDRTRLFEELPGGVTQRLLKTLNPEELRIARTLLGYPEDSIGRLMTPEYIAVRPEWTVAQTLEYIRRPSISTPASMLRLR